MPLDFNYLTASTTMTAVEVAKLLVLHGHCICRRPCDAVESDGPATENT